MTPSITNQRQEDRSRFRLAHLLLVQVVHSTTHQDASSLRINDETEVGSTNSAEIEHGLDSGDDRLWIEGDCDVLGFVDVVKFLRLKSETKILKTVWRDSEVEELNSRDESLDERIERSGRSVVG